MLSPITPMDYFCHCGKAFTRPENLTRHARNHDTVRPFRCTVSTCSKAFTRSDLLKRHMSLHESRERTSTPSHADHGNETTAASPLQPTGTSELQVDWLPPRNEIDSDVALEGSAWRAERIKRKIAEDCVGLGGSTVPDDRGIKRQNVIDGRPALTWYAQESNVSMTNNVPLIAYNQSPSCGDLSFDLAGGDFSIDLHDPLPWDNGMMWFMDETLSLYTTDTQEASTTDTMHSLGTLRHPSYDASGTCVLDNDRRPTSNQAKDAEREAGRSVTPLIDTSDDDKWPTNWNATGKVSFGAGARIPAASFERDLRSNVWERFWISRLQLDRVQQSLELAKTAPGPDVSGFRMPGSLELVNHFISLYFEKFEPQMPILHLPTFRSIDAPPLLLAAIISLGATFSRLPGAKTFSTELVELIRMSINVLFDLDSSNLRSDSLIHVSLLSCISGLLSGTKRTFELAEAARGTLVILCRRANLLNSVSMMRQLQRCDDQDVEIRWQRWAKAESRKRLGACISLLDSMFPAMLDTSSYISQGQMTGTVLPCDDLYWEAPTASMWMNLLGVASIPPSPFFALALSSILTPVRIPQSHRPQPIPSLNPFGGLMLVSALQHHIFEYGSQSDFYYSVGVQVPVLSDVEGIHGGFEGRRKWLRQSLESWRKYYYEGDDDVPLLQAGRTLYHLGHISLAVNVRVLFIAAGKMGWEQARQCRPELTVWAGSVEASKAIDHALDLLDVLENPASRDLSYVPGTAFVAILTLWAALKFGQPTATSEPSRSRQRDRLSDRGMVDMRASEQDPVSCSKGVLEFGVGFLESLQAWRFGTALALVIAKQLERDDQALYGGP